MCKNVAWLNLAGAYFTRLNVILHINQAKTFAEAGEDEKPADNEEGEELPLDAAEILDPRRQLQDAAPAKNALSDYKTKPWVFMTLMYM